MDDYESLSRYSAIRRFKHNSQRVQREITSKYLEDAKDCHKEIQNIHEIVEDIRAALLKNNTRGS